MIEIGFAHRIRSKKLAGIGLALLLVGTMSSGVGCSDAEQKQPGKSAATTETRPSNDQTMAQSTNPEWVLKQRTWPDTLRYVFDSTLEIMQDDLMLRLRMGLALDVSNKEFIGEQPLRCDVLMTVRPVPVWPLAQGLSVDSVVVADPVKNRTLKGIAMLSFQRTYDDQTVRTQFFANMGDYYRQSPDLAEGQELHPTIYLSWDGRIIIASMPPVTLSYIKE